MTPPVRLDGLAGLEGPVVVHRDEWGIPHIRATRARDAFFAQGFVQAEDRLGQLEYDRRRAAGRWAEVAGPAAVPFDVLTRRLGLVAAARREHDRLPDDVRAVLEAFADGVNAFLALGRERPPDLELARLDPEPWEPWECAAVFLVRHVVFATWQRKLWRGRVGAALGAGVVAALEGGDRRPVPLVVPPGGVLEPGPVDPRDLAETVAATGAFLADAGGSNSWALDGRRTASGRPLLAGDPHRPLEVPNVYYQCHLACPEFDAIGLAFVGVPGLPHFGHNDRVAWCVTNANGDYQDLFVERFPSGDPARCVIDGVLQPVAHRSEVVEVRGADAVAVDCYETPHGPVVFGDPATGIAISLRATALAEPSTTLRVLAPMLAARSVDALEAVMRDWVDPANNLLSADVDGGVSYHYVGRIPVRAAANAWGPVPGWTGEHEWRGFVPYDELPHVRDPEEGVLVTANQRVVGPEYPHRLGVDYARPDRAQRVHARLAALRDATVDDMAAVHGDRRSPSADVWVERLLRVAPRDGPEAAARACLGAWDRVVDADSAGAALYLVARDAVGRRLARDPRLAGLRRPLADEPAVTFQPLELRLWPLLTGLLQRDDPTFLEPGRTWDDVLAAALADAVARLRAELGHDPAGWRWGALHRAAPRHPLAASALDAARLDPPAVEVGGDSDTVCCAAHPAGLGFGVSSASVARYVFDLADWDRSAWVVPLGASGDPRSPHFADQQGAWVAGELLPMRYGWGRVAAAASSTTELHPA